MLVALAVGVALNAGVTQESLGATVCVVRWTESVRPAGSVTRAYERAHLRVGQDPRAFVVDHIVPLSLGGHPSATTNLQVQPVALARAKDVDERRLHRAVCAGRMSLTAARAEILRLWGPRRR